MARIRTLKNGPLLVEGDGFEVTDADGNGYPVSSRPIALCRCGASTKKPFCDGTHASIGFQAGEAAPSGSVQD